MLTRRNTPETNRQAIGPGFVLLLILVSAASQLAHAHAPDQSYVFLRIDDHAIDGRIEINMTDLNTAVGIALDTEGAVTRADIVPHLPMIEQYMLERVAFAPDGVSQPLEFDDFDVVGTKTQYLHLKFSFADFTATPRFVDVDYAVLFDARPSHRGFLVVEHHWKTGMFNNEANVSLIFGPGDTRQTLTIGGSVMQGVAAMVGQGTHHIWIGIDHILFLLALLLPSVMRDERGDWKPVESFRPAFIYVVKIVTIFTVAHTITLSAAALGAISLPSRFVESVIALSIAVAALDVFVPIFRQRIWWVAFVFGLFHGFGFASVLGDIGIAGQYLLHTLLAFNVGVELGQVAIVAGIFPVLFLLRRGRVYSYAILRGGAAAMILVSMYWFVERGFEVDLPAGRVLNLARDLISYLPGA